MGRMRGIEEFPAGLRYLPDVLTSAEHAALLSELGGVDYGDVRMHGQVAKRVVRHYGVRYEYEPARALPGEPLPGWLWSVRERCASLLGRAADDLAECLLTRYPPGATIGWHRDAPMFGDVVGVSLGSACVLRFQRGTGAARRVFEQPVAAASAYVLTGASRNVWQHSIPPVVDERYSITFRTLRRALPG